MNLRGKDREKGRGRKKQKWAMDREAGEGREGRRERTREGGEGEWERKSRPTVISNKSVPMTVL